MGLMKGRGCRVRRRPLGRGHVSTWDLLAHPERDGASSGARGLRREAWLRAWLSLGGLEQGPEPP